MRLISLIFAAVMLGTVIGAPVTAFAEVGYHLISNMQGGALQGLTVEMRFKANADGQAELQLPDHYRGAKHLYAALKDLEIQGAQIVETPTPSVRLIHSAPNADIIVRYHIDANKKAGEPPQRGTESYPAIAPDYFHIFGLTLFVRLKDRETEAATLETSLPEGWNLASSADRPNLTVGDVTFSIILCKQDIHFDHLHTANTDIRVASTGQFHFDLNEMNEKISRIVEAEQAFWGDGPKTFLITISPLNDPGSQSISGTGISGAFDVMITDTFPADKLTHYIAHEYFHSWNPLELGGPEAGGLSGYWFSEGLTDYYARKLALRSGMITLKAYVDNWNDALNRNAISPVRAKPNSEIAKSFWKNEDVSDLAYDRGAILAVLWNAKWHKSGVTLDQVMHALHDRAKAHPDLDGTPFPDRLTAVTGTLKLDIADDLHQHITDGVPVALPVDAFGGCLKVITEDVPRLDPGYDSDRSAVDGIFRGIDPESNAYEAGLRNGMKRLERLSGNPNDSHVPFSFRVQTADGKIQVITYMPQSKMRYSRQHIVMPDSGVATCTAAVAAY